MSKELKTKNVVISNYITRSAQSLTLAEKRILFAGIAKLAGVNGEVKISAKEYADTFDLSLDTAYTQMKDAAENMLKRTLTWQVMDGNKIGTLRCLWLQGYRYFKDEGYIAYRFSEYIFPFLFELQKEFTKYQLKQACALRSVHSWRLLELFEQFRQSKENQKIKNGWLTITIEEFWHAIEATESYKSNFYLLKIRVIEPAIKELVQKDNWLIEWEAVKKGRKVIALKFKFLRNPQLKLNLT